jgi:hypothetical protein
METVNAAAVVLPQPTLLKGSSPSLKNAADAARERACVLLDVTRAADPTVAAAVDAVTELALAVAER